jgi:hypothetical protein
MGWARQGDQIGRIFSYWVIVSLGQFFEKHRIVKQIFGLLFSMVYIVKNF